MLVITDQYLELSYYRCRALPSMVTVGSE